MLLYTSDNCQMRFLHLSRLHARTPVYFSKIIIIDNNSVLCTKFFLRIFSSAVGENLVKLNVRSQVFPPDILCWSSVQRSDRAILRPAKGRTFRIPYRVTDSSSIGCPSSRFNRMKGVLNAGGWQCKQTHNFLNEPWSPGSALMFTGNSPSLALSRGVLNKHS